MKEYDELVNDVAKQLYPLISGDPEDDYENPHIQQIVKTAIRAMQDWMPDCGATKSLVERMSVEALSYQHFKTLGRNDENN
jgi:hypothetical protein